MEKKKDSIRHSSPCFELCPKIKQKSRWHNHLNKVVHAYYCTKNDATSYAPFFPLFGKAPRLPIDLMFNLKPPSGFSPYPEYVESWRNAMPEAYKIASETAQRNAEHGKKQYDEDCIGTRR